MEAERRGIIYIVPTALQKSGRDVQKRFTVLDAVREELFRQLSVFPISLLRLLSTTQRGQLIITAEGAEYNPETQIAKVSVTYLMRNRGISQEEVTPLLDHLLGSEGIGRRLSEGYGRTPQLKNIGQTIKQLFEAGNYVSPYAQTNEREYLAQGIRFYLFDPEQLIKKDAALYEFLKEKFFNESFWQEVLRE